MGTIAVDNVKRIRFPWLKYRAGVAWGGEVAEKITVRKWQNKLLMPQPYMGITGNWPILSVVMVIYDYIARIRVLSLPPMFLYNK